MILGVGIDIVSIQRIQNAVLRFSERFLNRCFSPSEQAHVQGRGQLRFASLAKRFAAKEACAKAFGTGIGQHIGWKDLYVENLTSGQPLLSLSLRAQNYLAQITPSGFSAKIHLSLADDIQSAHAMVVISLWKA